jgi:hypothetical protein
MYKDPTNFRNRFQAYKNGKMPYKNGRPVKFEDGTEPIDGGTPFGVVVTGIDRRPAWKRMY